MTPEEKQEADIERTSKRIEIMLGLADEWLQSRIRAKRREIRNALIAERALVAEHQMAQSHRAMLNIELMKLNAELEDSIPDEMLPAEYRNAAVVEKAQA